MVAQISNVTTHKPLGTLLKEAGLISDYQIQVALQDQQYDSSLLFGEILALRGWISQDTADFFAVELPKIQREQTREKLGVYLKQANLLTDEQINSILQEQKRNFIRFGSAAVLKGYLKQETLDFFSEYLFPTQKKASYVMTFDPQTKEKTRKPQQSQKPQEIEIENKETRLQAQLETYFQLSKDTYLQLDSENQSKTSSDEIKWFD